MRHLHKGRRLNRSPSHRKALFRSLALALFRHERIITTVPKAKEARGYIERLITLARKGDVNSRRRVLAELGDGAAKAEIRPEADVPKNPEKADTRQVIQKLFTEIAPRYIGRPGGYTRVLKRPQRRLGDAGATAFLELVKPGDKPAKKKATPAPVAPAPAPKVEAPPPPAPAAPAPTAETPPPASPEAPPAS